MPCIDTWPNEGQGCINLLSGHPLTTALCGFLHQRSCLCTAAVCVSAPMQLSFCCLVYPCLVITYMGQASFLIGHPDAYTGTCAHTCPHLAPACNKDEGQCLCLTVTFLAKNRFKREPHCILCHRVDGAHAGWDVMSFLHTKSAEHVQMHVLSMSLNFLGLDVLRAAATTVPVLSLHSGHYCPSPADPFWNSVPGGAFWPMLIVATATSVVASQALISGVFSIMRQVGGWVVGMWQSPLCVSHCQRLPATTIVAERSGRVCLCKPTPKPPLTVVLCVVCCLAGGVPHTGDEPGSVPAHESDAHRHCHRGPDLHLCGKSPPPQPRPLP